MHAVRPFRSLLALWFVYECSRVAFFYAARGHGLLSGVSTVRLGTLSLGVWVLVLRLAVLFYVPLALVYRLGTRRWSTNSPCSGHRLRAARLRRAAQGGLKVTT